MDGYWALHYILAFYPYLLTLQQGNTATALVFHSVLLLYQRKNVRLDLSRISFSDCCTSSGYVNQRTKELKQEKTKYFIIQIDSLMINTV